MSQLGLKFKNADAYSNDNSSSNNSGGGFFSNLSLNDLLKSGSQIYSSTLQSQSQADTANAAVQLEKLKVQQAQAANAASVSTASSVATKIKAYALPLTVIGLFTVGGIAAYFYFKKKKA